MSTAVDTAFDAIVSAGGEAPRPLHLTCLRCYPAIFPGSVAFCGRVNVNGPSPGGEGRPVCAKCVALDLSSPLPCGHP